MKTQIYLTTLLALAIQVMVIGQTRVNQVESSRARTLPVLGGVKAKVIAKTSESPENNVYFTSESRTELLKQAEELLSDVRILRNEAENNSGPEKEGYLKQANIIYKQAEANQVKAAEIAAKINKETYRINKENLNAILGIIESDSYANNQARNLISDASVNIRLGQEMREEAYSMPTGGSKVGSLVNAEEKEALAISQQEKALELLKNGNPQQLSAIKAILNGNTLATR